MFWNLGKIILLDDMNDTTETAEMPILVIFLFVVAERFIPLHVCQKKK